MDEPRAPAPHPAPAPAPDPAPPPGRRKGPLSFLSGAITSALLCVLSLRLSKGLVVYFALHPPTASSRLAQSIASALKTLLVGMGFLATFSFGFIAVGLTLVLGRSLLAAGAPAIADSATAEPDQSA